MQPRSRARYLAPIALAAVLLGTYLVAQGAVSIKGSRSQTSQRTHRRPRTGVPFVYVVKPGDNLTSIANRTGVPVGEIESLNPKVQANSLQAGQRLRLLR